MKQAPRAIRTSFRAWLALLLLCVTAIPALAHTWVQPPLELNTFADVGRDIDHDIDAHLGPSEPFRASTHPHETEEEREGSESAILDTEAIIRLCEQLCLSLMGGVQLASLLKEGFIVEFTGIAGVGKTEISRRVRGILQERGEVCHLLKLDPWTKIHVVSSSPELLHALLGVLVIIQAKPHSPQQLFTSCYRWVRTQTRMWGCRRLPGIHLLDHGIFQTLRNIAQASREGNFSILAEQLLQHAPPPNLVVIVQASAETILDRRIRRSTQVGSLNISNMQSNISRLDEHIKAMLQVAKRMKSMEVVSVFNEKDDDPQAVAMIIANAIEKRVQQTHANYG